MKRVFSILLALAMAVGLSVGGYASGEPSGGASGSGLPEDVADLPTVEATAWVEVSDERVGLEGPAFARDGSLYVCSVGMSYPTNYILRIDEEKNITTIYEGPLSPLGLAFHENGKLFAVCREGELLIMDPDGTNVESVTPSFEGRTFSLNDLCFDENGDLFITDWQGSVSNPIGGVYLLTAESGYSEAVVIADKLAGPNGISLSPDEKTLWVGMTNELSVYRIDLNYDDGWPAAEKVEKIYENSGAGQPDSNKTDADGNLYQAIIQGGRILVFSPEGEPIANVLCPDSSLRMTSNLAIKPGTSEGYMLASGFGAGSWIYTFETLAPAKCEADAGDASGEASGPASGEASASGEATPIEAVIDISDGGEHTEEGVLIERDDLYVQGVNVSAGSLTLGGEAGRYDVTLDEDGVPHASEGDTWNSVILLDDPDHASDKLYGDGARENSLGSGVYTSGADSFVLVDNAFIWTTGAVRSAMAINSLSTAVVKNSFLRSDGAVTCYKPVTRLLLSTCRANVFVGGTAYYYNTEVVSGDWGALSTDTGGPNPTYLYAYNVDTDNTVGGYTTYADTNCFVEIYGSRMRSAEYGGFIACSGILRIGSSDEASEAALAYADEADLLASGEPSEIVAGRNDVVIHLVDSMGRNSGYNTLMGVLDISNTTLRTDKDVLTERDYYNDLNGEAYGESGYFLDYTAGSAIALRSTNADITLTNVTFDNYANSVTGRPIAIHSFLNYDARGAVSVPDGEESLGQTVAIADSVVDGDILHADYQRPMDVSLAASTLNGAVVSGTCAGWNALWTGVEDNGRAANFDAAKIYELLTKNESYETVWGVRLAIDKDSVWNVTGDSSLYSLTLAEGAQVVVPEGAAIYVDVDMSNADPTYDASTGTQIDAFEPGVTYTGVVITLP